MSVDWDLPNTEPKIGKASTKRELPDPPDPEHDRWRDELIRDLYRDSGDQR